MFSVRKNEKRGFTLLELMMSVGLLTIVLAAAMSGWIYTMFGERRNSTQAELDIDVRTSMEYLKRDLRLSSMDKIVFYPAGSGPYTSISFPKARDDDGDDLIELDGDGKIIWDETLVYHIWSGSPNELRITTFDPRDNTLTDAQRYEQLEDVVIDGNGNSTHNSANASTRKIFANLFVWNIWGKGAIIDGYNSTLDRQANVVLGSVLMSPGTHSFKFSSLEKNASSSGYKLGLDSIVMSPSGSGREAEAQLPAAAELGGTSSSEYMVGGSWSGNHQLKFTGTAEGDYVTLSMENDRWEETNFQEGGTHGVLTSVYFDEAMNPKDWIVLPAGWQDTWWSFEQTEDFFPEWNVSDDALTGTAVRMLIKGDSLAGGIGISESGGSPWFLVEGSDAGSLRILEAWIAKSASTATNASPNIVTNTVKPQRLHFGWESGPTAATLVPGNTEWLTTGPGINFDIDQDTTYALTFLVDDGVNEGNSHYYVNTNPSAVESYILPAIDNPTVADLTATNWSSRPNLIATNRLFLANYLWVEYAPTSYFTSQIFDTHMENPVYDEIDWNIEKPFGTAFSMKVRDGENDDLSDAPAWSNVTAFTSTGPLSGLSNKRYIQWQAKFKADSLNFDVPVLKDVTINWTGPEQITDVSLTYTKGPDYGVYALTVDGEELVKGLSIDIEIYKETPTFGGTTRTLTSSMSEEIEPRNTGK